MRTSREGDHRAERRSDARRNGERILDAAFAVFARSGVDAQMSDIAEAAGVGVATLYRNFPTKEAIVHALVLDRLVRCTAVANDAAGDDDPWRALVQCCRFITDLQLENLVLAQFLSRRITGSPELLDQRDAMYEVIDGIVHRAQAAGQLRPDANVSDVRMALVAFAQVSGHESQIAQRLVRRYVGIVMDGLRGPGREVLGGPPLTIEESEDAFALRGRQPNAAESR